MKIVYLILMLVSATALQAQIVSIPDANFKNALKNSNCVDADLNGTYESDADVNNDGEIQLSEALAVQSLKISNKNIAVLTGISSFTNLKVLNCSYNTLTAVDFSSNSVLQKLDCSGNAFVTLTLNGFQYLNELKVNPSSQLLTLTVTNNPLLTTFEIINSNTALTNLVTLDCSHNSLNAISLYGSFAELEDLQHINCSYNNISQIALIPSVKTVNASHNVLVEFVESYRDNLTSVDISSNHLTKIDIYNCINLSNVIYDNNPMLEILAFSDVHMTSLAVSNLSNLAYFSCQNSDGYTGTKFNTVTFSNLPALISINCYNNNLTSLNLTNLPSLNSVGYGQNPLTALTFSGLAAFTELTFNEYAQNPALVINNMQNLQSLTFDLSLLTNISVTNNPALTELYFHQGVFGQLNMSNLPALNHFSLNCFKTTPYTFNLNNMPALATMKLDVKNVCNFSLTNLPLLHDIVISGRTSFALSNLPQLYKIEVPYPSGDDAELQTLTLSNLPSLYELDLSDNNVSNLTLNDLPSLHNIDVGSNAISTLSLTNLPNLYEIDLSYNYSVVGSNYTFSNLPNLYSINLNHSVPTFLTLNNLPLFHDLIMSANPNITSLAFNNLPKLYDISVMSCANLSTVTLSNMPELYKLIIGDTNISGINVSNFPNLYDLRISNNDNITGNNIVLSNLPQLYKLDLSSNDLTSYTLTGFPSLFDLDISFNTMISAINLNLPALNKLDIEGDNLGLVNLDLSSCPNIKNLNYSTGWIHDKLKYINLKNGNSAFTSISIGSSVKNVCVDNDAEKTVLQSLDSTFNNVIFTDYCTFTPGGTFYTVSGNTTFDSSLNGCDSSDPIYPIMNFNVLSGSITSNYYANNSGSYLIPLIAGTYNVAPVLENPDYFLISPTSATVNFPASSSLSQNFCVTPNGSHSDLEITLLPITSARPGFNAKYKIIYKNKGNQPLSGTINLIFNDNVSDYVSSSPAATTSTGNLSWSYSNLLPLVSASAQFELNLNSPVETPALDSGNVLTYNVSSVIAADEFPQNNSFDLNQVVVNSLDPNDKTCLEGNTINQEMVGKYVHYMIRFENKGTANAQNVVVKDMIDLAKFDIASLIPLDASHPFTTRITSGNKVEFIFENINLPFNDANNDGYVAFKIKTKPTLVIGNTFSNSAAIYFDYNAAILTNSAVTSVQVLGIDEKQFSDHFTISPNPATDFFDINSKSGTPIKSISIYNLAGQLVQVAINQTHIEISALAAGMYVIKIQSERGISSAKLIKK